MSYWAVIVNTFACLAYDCLHRLSLLIYYHLYHLHTNDQRQITDVPSLRNIREPLTGDLRETRRVRVLIRRKGEKDVSLRL
jgi:hypothetical protein